MARTDALSDLSRRLDEMGDMIRETMDKVQSIRDNMFDTGALSDLTSRLDEMGDMARETMNEAQAIRDNMFNLGMFDTAPVFRVSGPTEITTAAFDALVVPWLRAVLNKDAATYFLVADKPGTSHLTVAWLVETARVDPTQITIYHLPDAVPDNPFHVHTHAADDVDAAMTLRATKGRCCQTHI